jgi:adenylate cyclase
MILMRSASWRHMRIPDASALLLRLRGLDRQRLPIVIWLASCALVGLYVWSGLAAAWRERLFDHTTAFMRQPQRHVTVVDIDRAAITKFTKLDNWPLSRSELAILLDEIGKAKPALVVLDVLIDGPDPRSPAALARQFAEVSGDASLIKLADGKPDGDQLLMDSLSRTPTVLGAALHPERPVTPIPDQPLIVRGTVAADQFWQGEGWIAPSAPMLARAAGLGVMVLDADADGTTRRVPLFAAADRQLLPGLSLTAVRVFRKASTLIIDSIPGSLMIADRRIPLPLDGMLRLVPGSATREYGRTVSAAALAEPATQAQLAGRIVLLGSSAPEAGGYRSGIGRAVTSVQLHADAIEQILSGIAPKHASWTLWIERIAPLFAAAAALLAGRRLPPLQGALATLASLAALGLVTILLGRISQNLFDPLPITLAALSAFAASAITTAAETRARAAAVRHRFEQHLAPEVVQRIVDNPSSLKLSGEMRDITALFTDVEGFTAMTERAGAQQLIALLDDYFDGISDIIAIHGGLIDKIVGDAVHAYFNVPFDLTDHHKRAFDCAKAILAFAQGFEQTPAARALAFGRTRIGLESGQAIVGDVGGGRKLDYTAHGNVVNSAARLEAANKTLGTSICIGPEAGRRLGDTLVRPIGRIELRGRSEPQQVFEPRQDRIGV